MDVVVSFAWLVVFELGFFLEGSSRLDAMAPAVAIVSIARMALRDTSLSGRILGIFKRFECWLAEGLRRVQI